MFLRVLEIPDGFTWNIYLTRSMTVEDAIKIVCDQLGLAKVLSGPGGGVVDYAIEEVWKNKNTIRRLYIDCSSFKY